MLAFVLREDPQRPGSSRSSKASQISRRSFRAPSPQFAVCLHSVFLLCLLLVLPGVSDAQNPATTSSSRPPPIMRVTRPPDRFQKLPDLVCNEGTDYKCVCNRSLGNMDNVVPPCYEYIQIEKLPVMTLTARNINLTARLYTSESYEDYFKRRIAQIVSSYCQNLVNECPGITLRVDKDNVILLRVEYSEPTHLGASPSLIDTSISFVVAKAPVVGNLQGYQVMEPEKIKSILAGQYGPLSRVLGGIHIRELAISMFSKPPPEPPVQEGSNSRLQVIVGIVTAFFVICYAVAIYRICRLQTLMRVGLKQAPTPFFPHFDPPFPLVFILPLAVASSVLAYPTHSFGGYPPMPTAAAAVPQAMPAADKSNTRLKVICLGVAAFFIFCYSIAVYRIYRDHRRKQRVKKREAGLTGAEQTNYGACTEKLLPYDHGKENGRRRSKSHEKADVEAPTQKKTFEQNATLPNDSSFSVVDESPALDPRRIRMFDYDPSQLPAELLYDENEDYGISCDTLPRTAHRVDPKKMEPVRERSEGPEPPSEAISVYKDEPRSEALSIRQDEVSLPSVVLVPSTSIHESHPAEISVADMNENYPITEHCEHLENTSNLLSSGCDSPPIDRPRSRRGSRQSDTEAGDKEGVIGNSASGNTSPLPLGDRLEALASPGVTKSHTAHKFGHWSSDESDVEHSEVYNKLAEEEDEDEDNSKKQPRRARAQSNSESESEDERYTYERLRESPMPPVATDAALNHDSP
ncbi:hypothetical protein L596_018939 [Steinernema carpocapsae]|uniref:Uncharacterized protein n=2 Tax=Steinernema carpocapsae TaxID=34508 RepID=A0A4U5N6Y9_STECR|nr:hypothetical protein L596_018939 [Steinernema carpocapsae]